MRIGRPREPAHKGAGRANVFARARPVNRVSQGNREGGIVWCLACMAFCRITVLSFTLGLAIILSIGCPLLSGDHASDDPAGGRGQRARLLISEGAKQATTHGMTATPLTTPTRGASVASALGSAAVGGLGWLCGGRRRTAESGIGTRRSWTAKSGATVSGEGRRALSLLAPAVAPRAGTSALFVVRAAAPASAAATPRVTIAARETSLLEATDRALCRPSARASPLRFDISKPRNSEIFLEPATSSHAARPGSSSLAAGSGSAASTSEMICGGDGAGGMTSSFTWLESVNSTMDEVKNLIVNQEGSSTKKVFAVAAREQVRGRGTKGRAWIGLPGNVFLTVAIPLDRVPVPLSLIPLRVGTLIAPEIQRRLLSSHRREEQPTHEEAETLVAGQQQQQQEEGQEQQPRVSLKWPNDILLGESKVAGVLIEAELPFLLVGIGVNVRHKPEVPRHGPDRGRPATCLADFGVDSTDEAVKELSAALTEKLCLWASGTDSADAALSEWSRWVDWSLPLEIRDEGRAVTAVGVAPDGRLRVVDPTSGKEELLSTEYLL